MLLVENVDDGDFLIGLFRAMCAELPSGKKEFVNGNSTFCKLKRSA